MNMANLKTKTMANNNYTIHYLGFGVRTLKDTDLIDVIWHLGAQYGGSVYNTAFASGIITIDEVNRAVVIRPTIQELVDKSIQELL
jgi:hypothetical protein